MKRARKLSVLLLAMLVLSMLVPGAAFAKKSKDLYVPIAGARYDWDYGRKVWNKDPSPQKFTATFSKDGKVKTVKYSGSDKWEDKEQGTSDDWSNSDSIKYTWKGNNLKAISFTHKDSNKGAYEPGEKHDRSRTKTYNMTASISKKKPKKMKESVKEVWKNKYEKGDNGTRSDSRSTTFKWNKKDGTALCENTYGDGGKDRRGSYITLKSGRRTSDWADNMKATYYKDGKLKSIMITYGDGGYHKEEFNKNGYLTKTENSNKGYDENGRNKQYDSKETTTLTWKMSGKKPLSVEVSRQGTNMDGKWTDKFKWVFTKTMKVSKVRNCDAYGLPVWLGAEMDYDIGCY